MHAKTVGRWNKQERLWEVVEFSIQDAVVDIQGKMTLVFRNPNDIEFLNEARSERMFDSMEITEPEAPFKHSFIEVEWYGIILQHNSEIYIDENTVPCSRRILVAKIEFSASRYDLEVPKDDNEGEEGSPPPQSRTVRP